jgi:hypothetical protein
MATIPINDTAPRIAYTATSSQTVFPYPFWISDEEDIIVYQNGVALELTTDYTVSDVLEPTGGDVTLVTGATLNDEIVIVRDIPVKRVSEFQTGGSFQASVLNATLSKHVAMIQQVENNQSRSLQLSVADTFNGNMNLPTITASKYLKVKDDASGWEIADGPMVTNSSLSPEAGDAHKVVVVNAAEDDLDILSGVGTAGQVLSSNGTSSAPSWQDLPESGGWISLVSQDISGTPTNIDFTTNIDSTYDEYMFVLSDVTLSSTSGAVVIRTSTDGGTSFDSGATDYAYAGFRYDSNGGGGFLGSANSRIFLWNSGSNSTTAGDVITSIVRMHTPANSNITNFDAHSTHVISTGYLESAVISGSRLSAADVDAVRFTVNTGTYVSENITMYGLTK